MITEADIQKQLAEAREREKDKHWKQCPFCADGSFCGKTCECCKGTGAVSHLGTFMVGYEMRVRYEVKFLNAFFGDEPDSPTIREASE